MENAQFSQGLIVTAATPLYRIAIADDMANVRLALRVLLESLPNIKIVAEADDLGSLLALPAENLDLLLLDWELANPNYKNTISQLRARFPRAKILVVSVHLESRQKAIDGGANAFFHKGDSGNRLQAEIKHLLMHYE